MAAAARIGLVVGSFAVGLGMGYLIAKAHWREKYDLLAQKEIDEAREYYQKAKMAHEAQVKRPLVEVVEYLGYTKVEEPRPESEPDVEETGAEDPIAANEEMAEAEASGREDQVVIPHVVGVNRVDTPPPMVGPQTGDIWDYEVELAQRAANPGRPYIIHVDEYGELNADEGYNTVCLTLYEDDNVLADERDEVIDNVDELVGLDNLQKFGHGTDNFDALLIRNELLKEDIEILKAKGSYGEEVAGFLKHEYTTERIPKRHERFDDDSRPE